ncbi:c-type cytochrome [Maritimibacter fusiformis]|uniref:Cytochrome c family protein n=1 Tax=Maritimibacter fusiformis TaxID=2603819 RepID=A0A5D0RNC9_9RHOB|nr:cytochrome c family protein [Maritimibacter fusiformis]TYB82084.1 cytochrome c family protein [Maritimibacter fusiformis]
MFDTMTITKVLASLAGALLIFLFANWAASSLYHVGAEAHGDEEGPVQGYVIAQPEEEEEEAEEEEVAEVTFEDVFAEADVAAGEKAFNKCKSCHSIEEGKNGTGPSLYGVVGADIAHLDDYNYSDAVAGLEGEWTPERLNDWLADPRGFAPGTKMTLATKKLEDRANVIAYLATIGG